MESEIPETSEFTVQDEKALGQEISTYILADSLSFSVLDQQEFVEVRNYLNQRVNFLSGTDLVNQNTFDWEVNVIDDASIHAFSLPGGYLFLSKGLLNALENDAELLGVLGFHVVLSDQGIALNRLESAYGFGLLLDVSLGRNTDVISDLVDILYSDPLDRTLVELAEERSIRMICPTEFQANGLVQMLTTLDTTEAPLTDWERVYPGNGERIARLTQFWEAEQCEGNVQGLESYADFKDLLP